MTKEEIEERNRPIRERWQEMLGDFKDLAVLDPAGGEGRVRTFVELQFERGKRYVTYEWEGTQLVGIDLRMSPPEESPGSLDIYPTGAGTFVSFSLDSPQTVRVLFDSNSLKIDAGDGFFEALRTD
jgi:hypothetical protein